MNRFKLALILLTLTLFAVHCCANILYVSTTGNDTNSGLSWALAKKTISAALTSSISGDQVWVSSGIYLEHQLNLPAGVALYGGFLPGQTLANRNFRTNVTTIDGGSTNNYNYGSVVSIMNNGRNDTVLDGFTLINGSSYSGGGIYIYNSSPVIRNNIIKNCRSNQEGAGIDIVGINSFSDNTIIQNNIISNCKCYGEEVPKGHGIYIRNANVNLINNVISNCSSISPSNINSYGGGIYLYYYENYHQINIISNTIINNSAYIGAGIYVAGTAKPYIANNIIANNFAKKDGVNIYYENLQSGILDHNDVYTTGIYSNYFNSPLNPTDAHADPMFISASDYHLSANSPLIDAGGSSYNPYLFGTEDVDGNPRISNSQIDIGAFESSNSAQTLLPPTFSPNGGLLGTTTIYENNTNATIFYTTDGSTPSATHGTPLPSGSGNVSTSVNPTIIKAVAVKAGLPNSSVSKAVFRNVGVIYVNGLSGSDDNSGLSWNSALKTIKAAIDEASIYGDQIWAAAGSYNELLTLTAGVSIYGGFLNGQNFSNRDFRSHQTVIDGSGFYPFLNPSIRVMNQAGNDTVIDGLTVTNGGGIVCMDSSPIIQNCIIRNNESKDKKYGGVYVSSVSSGTPVIIQNNYILQNFTPFNTGAIQIDHSNAVIVNNIVSGNYSNGNGLLITGANTNSIKLINNTIVYNQSYGRGLQISNDVHVIAANNIIAINGSAFPGADIYVNSSLNTYNTLLFNNDIYSPLFDNLGHLYSYYGILHGSTEKQIFPQFTSSSSYKLALTSGLIDAGDSSYYLSSYPAYDIEGNPRIVGTAIDIGAVEGGTGTNYEFTGTVKLYGVTGNYLYSVVSVKVDNGPSFECSLYMLNINTGTFKIFVSANVPHIISVKPHGFLSQSVSLPIGANSFTFDGGAATNGTGLIPGDTNDDNIIDDYDLTNIIYNFGFDPQYGYTDFNGDNTVDDIDLLDVINNFLMSGS